MKNIKLLFLLLIVAAKLNAQSPYLSVKVKMDSIKTTSTAYLLEIKFCEPKRTTERGSWFTHDTSDINFGSLKEDEVRCNSFFKNGDGIEILSGGQRFDKYNAFDYGNQVFAWEKIIVFRISDTSDTDKKNAMYLVIPVVYKSFITSVNISGIEFQAGQVVMIDKPNAEYINNRLVMTCTTLSNCGSKRTNTDQFKWIMK